MEFLNRIKLTRICRLYLLREHNRKAYIEMYVNVLDSTDKCLDNAKAPTYLDEVRDYIEQRRTVNNILKAYHGES